MKTEIVFLSDLEALLVKAIADNNINGVDRTLCQLSKWKDLKESHDAEYNSFYVCIYLESDKGFSGSGYAPMDAIDEMIKKYKQSILLKEKKYEAAAIAVIEP